MEKEIALLQWMVVNMLNMLWTVSNVLAHKCQSDVKEKDTKNQNYDLGTINFYDPFFYFDIHKTYVLILFDTKKSKYNRT